jgi:hypothetical protein
MTQLTKQGLLTRAIEIKTETQIGANTADRVGSLLEDMILFMGGLVPAVYSVAEMEDIEVSIGTELNTISFPSTASVTLDNEEIVDLNVSWSEDSTPTYDSASEYYYTFTGSLELTQGIANPNDIMAYVDVHVYGSS